MRPRTITSREFNQDTSGAKKSAGEGPVFITDRGKPAHVLLTYADYLKLAGQSQSLADLLALPGEDDVEFEVPARTDVVIPADLT